MFKRYKARITSTIFFIVVMSVWNIIFYGYSGYTYDPTIDLPFSFVTAAAVWWLSSKYDRSYFQSNEITLCDESAFNHRLLESPNFVFNILNHVVFKTDKFGKITMLNKAWEQLTGYSVDDSIGKNIIFWIHPDDRTEIAKIFIQVTEAKKDSLILEYRLRRETGEYVWLESNVKLMHDTSGNIVSMVGTLFDITERKQSEQQLKLQNEILALQYERLSTVANLSASIAHEVRNPLTSISGFLQLLKEQNQLKKEYIDLIFSEIDRIELVLSELLMLSKPQKIQYKRFDIIKTLDYVTTLISSKANMNSIKLTIELPNHPIWVYGDENQIKQIFINLFKNSIEAIENGGEISVSYRSSEHFVSIYIKDNGPGIPHDVLENIGKLFFTTKEKGTGLGLATCRNIIEKHNGKLQIYSKEGEGTTCEVIFPIYETSDSFYNEISAVL